MWNLGQTQDKLRTDLG